MSLLSSIGCAATNNVYMTSDPPEAKVFLDNRFMGCTPTNVEMSVSDPHVVRFERSGWGTHIWEYGGHSNPASYHAMLEEFEEPKRKPKPLPEYGPKPENSDERDDNDDSDEGREN